MTPLSVTVKLLEQGGFASQPFSDFLTKLAKAATGPRYSGTVTWNPANVASGAATAIVTVNVPGAQMGSRVAASFSKDLQGLCLNAWVSANGVVSANLLNLTGGAVNLAEGTLTVEAWT